MEQIQNTTRIQIQSVINFLQELGYTYFPNDCVFESIGLGYATNKTRRTISFATAVRLHNGGFMEWHGKYFNHPFDNIPADWIVDAQKAKIVHKAKLQYNKRTGSVITQSHMVSFLNQENVSLFIKQ